MKVCQTTHLFPPNFIGGIPNYVFNLSRALGQQGLEVEVYTGDTVKRRTSEQIAENVRVIRLPMLTLPLTSSSSDMAVNLRIIPSQLLALMKCNADLIHAHDLFQLSSHMAALASKISGKPLVLTMHSRYGFYSFTKTLVFLKRIHNYTLGRFTLKQAKKVIFVSHSAAKEFLEMGIDASKVEVIYPAIDVEEFSEMSNSTGQGDNFYEKKLGFQNNRIVLATGRIEKRKGFQYLIQAVRCMITREPRLKVVIVGPDAGYAGELKKLAASLDVDQYVVFTGVLSDLEVKLAMLGADIFVLPSEYDNFPEVALRAAFFGKPIVASNIGGIPEFIKDGQSGLLVEVGNIEHLAQSILLLLNNSELATKLGQQARRDVLERHTFSKMASKMVKVYEDVLAEAKLKRANKKGK